MENPSLINTKLGKYEIQSEIGRGGMGTVYRGYDPALDRYVAIKVLAPHLVWQGDFVERFMREARSAARLNHPSIVTIHDVGEQGGWYYFVMEFLEGISLTELIERSGPMAPERVVEILRPLASALDYAHHQGLVHRDIKPSNIVISDAGRVTLTDFGIARAAQESRLTNTGAVVGTPEYMSPEQAQGTEVDARSDQYSVAVMVYQMLSGRVPFEADSTLALMYKVVHDPPPPLSGARADLAPVVGAVLDRAMAKAPGDRFSSVSAFADALARACAGEPVVVAPPRSAAPRPAGAQDSPTVMMGEGAEAAPATPPPGAGPPPMPSTQVSQTPPPWTPQQRASTPPPPSKKAERRRPWGLIIGGLVVALLAVVTMVVFGTVLLLRDRPITRTRTPTPTSTAAAPTSTPEEGDEPAPPTATRPAAATDTPEPATDTPEPGETPEDTATPTETPTATPTPTPTPVPATSTPTPVPPTPTPVPPTNTPVPPPTNTPAPPPTSPPQPTNTPVPPPTNTPQPPPTDPPQPTDTPQPPPPPL